MNELPMPEETEEAAAENARRAREIIKKDIEELSQRLKPDNLKANAKANLKTGAKEAWQAAKGQAMNAISGSTRRAADSVATNGGPLLLMGLGAGWLAWSLRKQREEQHWYEVPSGGPSISEATREVTAQAREAAQGATHEVAERTQALAHRVTNKTQDVTERTRSFARRAAHDMGDRARQIGGKARDLSGRATHAISERASNLSDDLGRVQTRARGYAEDNPLAVGAAVIALGIGAGLLIPSTRTERKVMGPTRDRLLGRAHEVAGRVRETAQHIEETTRQTGREVQEALTEREFPH